MNRIEQLRQRMVSEKVDLVAIGAGAHLTWLTGLKPHADERALLLCVSQQYAGFLMPALEAGSNRGNTDLPFHEWSDSDGPRTALLQLLDQCGAMNATSLVLDETMRADFAALVQDELPNAARQFCETTIGALRLCKDADEYGLLKQSALLADSAMQAAWSAMKPGMTELDVAAVAQTHFTEHGAKPLFTIIGAGSNGAFPHHSTGDTPLSVGDVVVMDMGADLNGYPSDMTRSAVVGEKPDGYDAVYDIVESAVQAAMAVAKPGTIARDVDLAARSVIEKAGYGDFFTHRLGHGLGIEIHEPPYLTSTSSTVLEEGMVFSIEPGIYLPDRFGIRLEDIVILRAGGPEILSSLPRDAHIIG